MMNILSEKSLSHFREHATKIIFSVAYRDHTDIFEAQAF